MTLEEAIKRAKDLADFNRRLAGQYETTYTVKPDEKTRKAADTYAERALALDTVIAAANGDMTAEYTPKQTGNWQSTMPICCGSLREPLTPTPKTGP